MNGDISFIGNIGGNVSGTGELNGDISLPSGGGVTPEITMSAYVDSNIGVPSVNVIKSGTDEEPHFTLDFHNLKGATGEMGLNGYSPEITIAPLTGGNRINITSEEHPSGQTFDVMNGQDGVNGQDGINGVSPIVTITEITGGHEVNITDVDHPSGQSFGVMNGQNGQDGENGFSPAVTITEITGGHEINITDFLHPSGQTFDVMNGEQGEVGEGVPQGGSTGQFLKKSSNTDYDTEWSNINASDVVYDNTSSGLTASDAQGAIDEVETQVSSLINIYNVPASAYSLSSGSYGGFSYMAQIDISDVVPQSGETVIALIPRGGGTTNNVTVKLGGSGQNNLYIFTAQNSKPNVDIVTIKDL